MKLAPDFQRFSPVDTPPELGAQLLEAVELMNPQLSGHDYIRPLLFVAVIVKEGDEDVLSFDVFEQFGIGAARKKFNLTADEATAAKELPAEGHARLFYITPDARGACDVRVAEAKTPRA